MSGGGKDVNASYKSSMAQWVAKRGPWLSCRDLKDALTDIDGKRAEALVKIFCDDADRAKLFFHVHATGLDIQSGEWHEEERKLDGPATVFNAGSQKMRSVLVAGDFKRGSNTGRCVSFHVDFSLPFDTQFDNPSREKKLTWFDEHVSGQPVNLFSNFVKLKNGRARTAPFAYVPAIFDGPYKDDLRHGFFKVTLRTGHQFTCQYEKGNLQKDSDNNKNSFPVLYTDNASQFTMVDALKVYGAAVTQARKNCRGKPAFAGDAEDSDNDDIPPPPKKRKGKAAPKQSAAGGGQQRHRRGRAAAAPPPGSSGSSAAGSSSGSSSSAAGSCGRRSLPTRMRREQKRQRTPPAQKRPARAGVASAGTVISPATRVQMAENNLKKWTREVAARRDWLEEGEDELKESKGHLRTVRQLASAVGNVARLTEFVRSWDPIEDALEEFDGRLRTARQLASAISDVARLTKVVRSWESESESESESERGGERRAGRAS